jgi:hypothetical protein
MNKNNKSESGQALIYLVIGFVVFLGFVGLAIDGGRAYSDRRYSQNGSDAASLAGGGEAALYLENAHVMYGQWDCNASAIQQAMALARQKAIERAGTNNFTIAEGTGDNTVSTQCDTAYYGYLDKYLDVTVDIVGITQPSFSSLLFPNALENRVEAVTRVRPRSPAAFGHAIVALNNAPCQGNQNGAIFGGNGDTDINGGGVWTNGCLAGNGSSYNVDVINGSVTYAGSTSGTMNFNPEQNHSDYTLPPSSYEVPAPKCDGHWVGNLSGNLAPGLYCINGDVKKLDGVSGNGVTIYIKGDLSVNANDVVNLSAPGQNPDPSPAIAGVLFYVTGDVTINGNSNQWYLGMIYAPQGYCKINGTGGVWDTLHTQIICWDVEVTGTADIDITFDHGEQYEKPTSIELYR